MLENTQPKQTQIFEFCFTIDNPTLAGFTHLQLYNGYNEIVGDGYGNMNIQVPRGIYQLRIEMNEHVEDRDYRIDHDITDSISNFNTASSVPLKGFSSTYEYFENPSLEWSKKSTENSEPIYGTSIFLFFRYSNAKKSFDNLSIKENSFFILNENRQIIYSLNSENTKTYSGKAMEYFGTMCFNEKVIPGQYFILYKSKTGKREFPLYVFENWQTQVFMMIHEEPIFGSTKISIGRNGFSSENQENLQLDLLIQKMYNGIYILPDSLKNDAATGKWNNPMLGILSAYMYLMTNEESNDQLFKTILENLQTNILNNTTAPDLVALRLLGAIHFKQEIPHDPLPAPCMIAVGMSTFLEQSLKDPLLITKGSLVEKIFPNLKSDSIWTTYDPLPIKNINKEKISREDVELLSEEKTNLNKSIISQPAEEISERKTKRKEIPYNPKKDWITSSIFNQLYESNEVPDIHTLASQLQVTANTVTTTLSKLVKKSKLNAVANSILDKMNSKKFNTTINKISDKINNLLD